MSVPAQEPFQTLGVVKETIDGSQGLELDGGGHWVGQGNVAQPLENIVLLREGEREGEREREREGRKERERGRGRREGGREGRREGVGGGKRGVAGGKEGEREEGREGRGREREGMRWLEYSPTCLCSPLACGCISCPERRCLGPSSAQPSAA